MENNPTLQFTHTADKQKSSFHSSSLNQASNEDVLSAITGGVVWEMEPLSQRYCRLLLSLASAMVTVLRVAQNLAQETFLCGLVTSERACYTSRSGAELTPFNLAPPHLRRATRSSLSLQLAVDQVGAGRER